MSDQLLTTTQATAYVAKTHGIKRSPRTLQLYRLRGTGPTFLRFSQHEVRYAPDDLDAWVESLKSRCRVVPKEEVA